MDKDPIVVAGAARTPVGAFRGSLEKASAADLGAVAIGAAVERAVSQWAQVLVAKGGLRLDPL